MRKMKRCLIKIRLFWLNRHYFFFFSHSRNCIGPTEGVLSYARRLPLGRSDSPSWSSRGANSSSDGALVGAQISALIQLHPTAETLP